MAKSIKIYPEFNGDKKYEFFNDVDVISVPVRKHDGYGLYILEANRAGIPVVQPSTGAFPEIIEMTSGGIVYEPDSVTELASNLQKILHDEQLLKYFSEEGKKRVAQELSLKKMSEGLATVYNKIYQNASAK